MRLAILISLAILGPGARAAPVGDEFIKCDVAAHGGYLVPVSYAEAHRADIVSTLPDGPEVDGFWKVSEQIAVVSDRNLREAIEDAIKDPTLLFPDLTPGGDASTSDSLEYQRHELKLTLEHYAAYSRQYVGVVIDGHRYVVCNYAVGSGLDPAASYLFIHKIFDPKRDMHFLQCRFDWDDKKISNVALIGPWQTKDDH